VFAHVPFGLEGVVHVEFLHQLVIEDDRLRVHVVSSEFIIAQLKSSLGLNFQGFQAWVVSVSQVLQDGVNVRSNLAGFLGPGRSGNFLQEIVVSSAGDNLTEGGDSDLSIFLNIEVDGGQNIEAQHRSDLGGTGQGVNGSGSEDGALSLLARDVRQQDFDNIGVDGVSKSVDQGKFLPVLLDGVEFLGEFAQESLAHFQWAVEVLRDKRWSVSGEASAITGNSVDGSNGQPGGGVELLVLQDNWRSSQLDQFSNELVVGSENGGGNLLENQNGFLANQFSLFDQLNQVHDAWGSSAHGQGINKNSLDDFVFNLSTSDNFLVELFDFVEVEHSQVLDQYVNPTEDQRLFLLFKSSDFSGNLHDLLGNLLNSQSLHFLEAVEVWAGWSHEQIELVVLVHVLLLHDLVHGEFIFQGLVNFAILHSDELSADGLFVLQDQDSAGVGDEVISKGGVWGKDHLSLSNDLLEFENASLGLNTVVFDNIDIGEWVQFGVLAVLASSLLQSVEDEFGLLDAVFQVLDLGDVEHIPVGSGFPRHRVNVVGSIADTSNSILHGLEVDEDVPQVGLVQSSVVSSNSVKVLGLVVSFLLIVQVDSLLFHHSLSVGVLGQELVGLDLDHRQNTLDDVDRPFWHFVVDFEALDSALVVLNEDWVSEEFSNIGGVDLDTLDTSDLLEELSQRAIWHFTVNLNSLHSEDFHEEEVLVLLENDIGIKDDTGVLVLEIGNSGDGLSNIVKLVLVPILQAERNACEGNTNDNCQSSKSGKSSHG